MNAIRVQAACAKQIPRNVAPRNAVWIVAVTPAGSAKRVINVSLALACATTTLIVLEKNADRTVAEGRAGTAPLASAPRRVVVMVPA